MQRRSLVTLVAAGLVSTMSVPAWAAPAGMTDIEEAAAKTQIAELMYRYGLTHNTFDVEGYVALFTSDAQFGGGAMAFKGREDGIRHLAEISKDALAYPDGKNDKEGDRDFGIIRTIIQNPVIDVIDTTHAKGVFYVQIVTEHSGVPVIMLQGTYQNQFRKENGKWLISKMEVFSSMFNKEAGESKGLSGGRPKEQK